MAFARLVDERSISLLDKLETAVHEEQPQKLTREMKGNLLRTIYRQMDIRNTGRVSKQDLGSMLRKIDPTTTPQKVSSLLKKMSTDGDEMVSFEEFVEFYTHFEEGDDQHSDMIKATFRAWDTDRSGKLSRKEFFSVMKSLNKSMTDAKITLLYTAMDRDHDGKISYEEWIDYMFQQ
ncbi:unnamed protein product [Effrenium voratum]|nr:unnamed protein product [Effrenium voratum]